jgi:hypothetical protein
MINELDTSQPLKSAVDPSLDSFDVSWYDADESEVMNESSFLGSSEKFAAREQKHAQEQVKKLSARQNALNAVNKEQRNKHETRNMKHEPRAGSVIDVSIYIYLDRKMNVGKKIECCNLV